MEIIDSGAPVYHDVVIETCEEEKFPDKSRIVWKLRTKGGQVFSRKVYLTTAAQQIIIDDFRKIGTPLTEGLPQGMKDCVGKVVRIFVPSTGDVKFCRNSGFTKKG